MKSKLGMRTALAVLVSIVAAFAVTPLVAGKGDESGRVAKPAIVIEKGERCVEDTEFMRRSHMEILKHQRDETMHKGIRTREHSLQGCVDCHAGKTSGSVLGDERAFCQGCHSYAAVKLDCWECHSPKRKSAAAGGAR